MSGANIEKALEGFTLGEGPHWVEEKQELLLVDILKSSIHRYIPGTGEHYQIPVANNRQPHHFGGNSSVVPVEGQSSQYLMGGGLALMSMDWDGKSEKATNIKTIATIANDEVFNDGKCDPQGRFWTGSGGYTENGPIKNHGHIYSLGLDGQRLTQHPVTIDSPNGLGWTADSSRFFYIDTLKQTVDVFDFDSNAGIISNRRVLFDYQTYGVKGFPDGMTVDSQDNLWVASYMGANVIHIDSRTGVLLDTIDFSGRTSLVTSVTFGGPNLDTLYVTSGTFKVDSFAQNAAITEEAEAGSLFKVTNLGAKGLGGVSYKGSFK